MKRFPKHCTFFRAHTPHRYYACTNRNIYIVCTQYWRVEYLLFREYCELTQIWMRIKQVLSSLSHLIFDKENQIKTGKSSQIKHINRFDLTTWKKARIERNETKRNEVIRHIASRRNMSRRERERPNEKMCEKNNRRSLRVSRIIFCCCSRYLLIFDCCADGEGGQKIK